MRIGDLTGFNGITQTFVGGIANNPQVFNGVTVCQVTVDFFGHLGVDCVNPNNPNATPPSPQRQAMLNDKVEKLQATVTQQQKQIETLTAQLKEQAAQIQKVSAQLELDKAAPQTVLNNQ
jgi:septal ring factor EnvC (AmiA/AmiB activator)